VLEHPAVATLIVVEMLDAVVDWHEQGFVPLGPALSADPRCRFVRADFFARAASAEGLDPTRPGRKFHAILVDIDHTLLHSPYSANARASENMLRQVFQAQDHEDLVLSVGTGSFYPADPKENGYW